VLVIRVAKAETSQNTLGSGVARVMTCEESLSAEGTERVVDDSIGCLGGEALAPMRGQKLEAEFKDLLLRTIVA
jgi:hypothetical protein